MNESETILDEIPVCTDCCFRKLWSVSTPAAVRSPRVFPPQVTTTAEGENQLAINMQLHEPHNEIIVITYVNPLSLSASASIFIMSIGSY